MNTDCSVCCYGKYHYWLLALDVFLHGTLDKTFMYRTTIFHSLASKVSELRAATFRRFVFHLDIAHRIIAAQIDHSTCMYIVSACCACTVYIVAGPGWGAVVTVSGDRPSSGSRHRRYWSLGLTSGPSVVSDFCTRRPAAPAKARHADQWLWMGDLGAQEQCFHGVCVIPPVSHALPFAPTHEDLSY